MPITPPLSKVNRWNDVVFSPLGVPPIVTLIPSLCSSSVMAKIEGVVWLNKKADGVRDEGDEGFAGASVVLKKNGMAYDMNKHTQTIPPVFRAIGFHPFHINAKCVSGLFHEQLGGYKIVNFITYRIFRRNFGIKFGKL